jgi:hypothetical protein
MAWLANGAAYGAVATLNYHYPKYLDSIGLGAALFGTFLGLTYASQTVVFFILRRTRRWHYRRGPFYVLQTALIVAVATVPALSSPAAILGLAPVLGAALGLAYYSSIYYSLHAADRPGRNTGLHEAIIGSGVLLVPLLGGTLAFSLGTLRAPYLAAAGVGLLALLTEELLFRGLAGRRTLGATLHERR